MSFYASVVAVPLFALSVCAVRIGDHDLFEEDHQLALGSLFQEEDPTLGLSSVTPAPGNMHAEDFSSHDLLRMLSLDDPLGQEFLGLAAGNMATSLVQYMDSFHEKSKTVSLLELSAEERQLHEESRVAYRNREALRNHLLGLDGGEIGRRQAELLAQEDVIIQRAVYKALNIGELEIGGVNVSTGDEKWKLFCASQLKFHQKVKDDKKADGDSDEEDGSEEDEAEREAEQSELTGQNDAALAAVNGSNATNATQTKSTLSRVLSEVWKSLKKAAQAIYHFFFEFIRWEFQLQVVGGNMFKMGVPQLGWKCQPLHTCVLKIIEMGKEFMKLVGTIIWAIYTVLKEVVKSTGKFIGKMFGSKKNTTKSLLQHMAHAHGTADLYEGGFRVLLKGKNGTEPGPESVDDFVKDSVSTDLFSRTKEAEKQCVTGCAARMKGMFTINMFTILEAIALGNIGASVKIGLGTLPSPILGTIGGCGKCFGVVKEYFLGFMQSKSTAAAKKYFAAGQCNPHTVGMCMMLQKSFNCDYSAMIEDTSGKLIIEDRKGAQNNSTKSGAYADMKQFCDAFKGTKLELVKVKGEVSCLRPVNEDIKSRGGTAIGQGNATQVDLGAGCHAVLDQMKKFNKKCENVKGSHYTGFTFRGVYDFQSKEEVAEKCRALYNCQQDDSKNVITKETRVEWPGMRKQILDIVKRVDDYGEMPRSYSPEKASTEVNNLVQQVLNRVNSWQGEVGKKKFSLEKQEAPWGADLSNLFAASLWDDGCISDAKNKYLDDPEYKGAFAKEIKEVKKNDNGKGMETKSMMKLAHHLNVYEYDAGKQCKVDASRAETTFIEAVQQAQKGPKMDIYMNANEAKKSAKGWASGDLSLKEISAIGDSHIVLKKIKEHWYLKSCSLRGECGGATPGAVLKSIKTYEAKSESASSNKGTMHKFVDAAAEFMDVMKEANDGFLNGFKEDSSLYRVSDTGFPAAIKILEKIKESMKSSIKSGGEPYQISQEEYKKFRDTVNGDTHLKQFFKARGWIFEEVPDKKSKDEDKKLWRLTGVMGQELKSLRQVNRMLELLNMPVFEPITMTTDAVGDLSEYFFPKANLTAAGQHDEKDKKDPWGKLSGQGLVKVELEFKPMEETRADAKTMEDLVEDASSDAAMEEKENEDSTYGKD